MNSEQVQKYISDECDRIKALLLEKNKSYGNSVFQPVAIFAKSDPAEQIKVRIDDKLSRIARGSEVDNEDTVLDLIGYLVLMRVWQRIQTEKEIEIDIQAIQDIAEIMETYPEQFKN